jgi:hypothetical protein
MWERRSAYRALGGNLRGMDHVEYLGVYGRIILRWMFGERNGEAWNDQAENTDGCRALVIAVMNLRVP